MRTSLTYHNINVEVELEAYDYAPKDQPYGVAVYYDCDPNDPDKGSSEMSWYKTKAEAKAYYEKVIRELQN